MTGCSLPHIALWVLTLPVRLIGWAALPARAVGLPIAQGER